MRRIHAVTAVLAAGTLTVAAARPALLQEEHGMEMEGMEEMQMPEPTAQHMELQKHVGEYEGTITMFMPGMDATPAPAQETVRTFGPFWTTNDFTCEFMGMPYQGHGFTGYDPEKGKYVGTWIDNLSPALAIMEGEYDEAKKATVMHWEAPDMTGKVVPHRSEIVQSKDAYTMTFFTDGTKSMQIAMKRKSAM